MSFFYLIGGNGTGAEKFASFNFFQSCSYPKICLLV